MRITSTLLEPCWEMCGRGRLSEALAAGSFVAEQARLSRDDPTLAAASCLCAWFSLQLGAFESGLKHAGVAMEVAGALRDVTWQSQARAVYAWLLHEVGLCDEAAGQAQECVTFAERNDVGPEAASWASNVLAVISWTSKQLEVAESRVETAIALARGLADPTLLRWWLINLGGIHVEKGYMALAEGSKASARLAIEAGIAVNSEALSLAGKAGDDWTLKLGLCNAVEYHLALDEPGKASEMLARSEAIVSPGSRSLTHHLYNKGQVLARTGRLEEARLVCLDALAMAEGENNADGQYHACHYLSEIHERMGRFEEALAFHKRYHAIQSRLTEERVRLRVRIAEVHYGTEALKKAADHASLRADEATRSSLVDALTGVGNRRMLDQALDGLLQDGRSAWIAVLDLDHFKRINDRFGHPVGDEVLRRVGGMLRAILAPGDVAVRLGGEEFALILRDTQADAAAVCERLRRRISDGKWAGVHPELTVTASIGLAMATNPSSALDVMAEADRRLYAAKKQGRDRVVGDPRQGSTVRSHSVQAGAGI